MTPSSEPLFLATARERLRDARGQAYWRSLDELSQTEAFRELVAQEFPQQASLLADPITRRRFLMLMGASLALAGVSGCGTSPAPRERIVPYVRVPEGIVPGRPLFFATAFAVAGDVQGLLVESHEGRPTKIEGNPDHPANAKSADSPSASPPHLRFGPTDAFAQASVLSLYDPDRAQNVTNLGSIRTWDQFLHALRAALANRVAGPRLRILTETVASPTVAQQLRTLLQQNPAAKLHVYEPVGADNAAEGARLVFGENVQTHYHLDHADVIVALDADFLSSGQGHVCHIREFTDRRRVRQGNPQRRMNRLYVMESAPSSTGALADHRLPLRSGDVEAFARALAGRLDPRFQPIAVTPPPQVSTAWLDALARDLQRQRGASVIIAGEPQPPFVHALAHALNDFLLNTDRTVSYTAPAVELPSPSGSLRELADDMQAGLVDVLIILGGNPVYTAPVDLRLAECMGRVPFRVHLGLYEDETAEVCHWHISEAHPLESWGDLRGADGTVSIVQPLIAPLHGGKTASELLAVLAEQPERTSYEIVRSHWRGHFERRGARGEGRETPLIGDFEGWWRKTIHDGLAADRRLPRKTVTWRDDWMLAAPAPASGPANGLELNFRPDPTIFDGRFANNGWLQELPKPMSKLTWDNAAYLSPATAVRLGFARAGHAEEANEKVVELEYQDRRVSAPLWVLPGHADDSITIHLGYGRTRAGHVGTGLGFNANKLRVSANPWFGRGLAVHPTDRRMTLAGTQHHFLMENRDLVRSGTQQQPPVIPASPRRSLTLYNETEHPYVGDQWGMVIDLNVCVGCSACVVACQAENNIPVVGKEEVQRGREMHWIRVDRYYKGAAANPETCFQPVPCMHCENAPCELVCPVGATVHSSDGLNDMVYNRCVGTRYCSNNCPYKVRRFNFLQFADFAAESQRPLRNPEVTVRSRGVMEKCTYCVQRIRTAEIDAQREGRHILDGEIQTACQAVCPAGAIIFGNINDPRSKVAKLRTEPLHYALLADLNTRPRTTYLAALKNPNPEIVRLEQG